MINTRRKAHGIEYHVFYKNYLIIIKACVCVCNHVLPVSASLLITLMNYSRAEAPPGEGYVFLNCIYNWIAHTHRHNSQTMGGGRIIVQRTDFRAELWGPRRESEGEKELSKTNWTELPGGQKVVVLGTRACSWHHTHPRGSLISIQLLSTDERAAEAEWLAF